MAVWQCKFRIVPRDALVSTPASSDAQVLPNPWRRGQLANTYPERLIAVGAPRGASWSPRLEVWGSEDGDRFDVYRNESGISSVQVRVDMRRPRHTFVEAVVGIARDSQCVGIDEAGRVVEPTTTAFLGAMAESRAMRFVEDPERFLNELARSRLS
jgi:hypothetical protein